MSAALLLRDALAVVGGFVIGVLSGITGVGGGILMVPMMVLGFGFAQHVAQGTSLAAILPTAITGAVTHDRRGNVDRSALWMIGVPAALLAAVGALLAIHTPRTILVRLFGAVLLFAAFRMWRSRRPARPPADAEPLPDPNAAR